MKKKLHFSQQMEVMLYTGPFYEIISNIKKSDDGMVVMLAKTTFEAANFSGKTYCQYWQELKPQLSTFIANAENVKTKNIIHLNIQAVMHGIGDQPKIDNIFNLVKYYSHDVYASQDDMLSFFILKHVLIQPLLSIINNANVFYEKSEAEKMFFLYEIVKFSSLLRMHASTIRNAQQCLVLFKDYCDDKELNCARLIVDFSANDESHIVLVLILKYYLVPFLPLIIEIAKKIKQKDSSQNQEKKQLRTYLSDFSRMILFCEIHIKKYSGNFQSFLDAHCGKHLGLWKSFLNIDGTRQFEANEGQFIEAFSGIFPRFKKKLTSTNMLVELVTHAAFSSNDQREPVLACFLHGISLRCKKEMEEIFILEQTSALVLQHLFVRPMLEISAHAAMIVQRKRESDVRVINKKIAWFSDLVYNYLKNITKFQYCYETYKEDVLAYIYQAVLNAIQSSELWQNSSKSVNELEKEIFNIAVKIKNVEPEITDPNFHFNTMMNVKDLISNAFCLGEQRAMKKISLRHVQDGQLYLKIGMAYLEGALEKQSRQRSTLYNEISVFVPHLYGSENPQVKSYFVLKYLFVQPFLNLIELWRNSQSDPLQPLKITPEAGVMISTDLGYFFSMDFQRYVGQVIREPNCLDLSSQVDSNSVQEASYFVFNAFIKERKVNVSLLFNKYLPNFRNKQTVENCCGAIISNMISAGLTQENVSDFFNLAVQVAREKLKVKQSTQSNITNNTIFQQPKSKSEPHVPTPKFQPSVPSKEEIQAAQRKLKKKPPVSSKIFDNREQELADVFEFIPPTPTKGKDIN